MKPTKKSAAIDSQNMLLKQVKVVRIAGSVTTNRSVYESRSLGLMCATLVSTFTCVFIFCLSVSMYFWF